MVGPAGLDSIRDMSAAYAGHVQSTRYELIAGRHSGGPRDLAAQLLDAGHYARAVTAATSAHERSIRDVAAGVAAPALIGFVVWIFEEAHRRGVQRLRFLSRDGEVLYELARRLAPRLGSALDLEYVYSSRLTWSLAATDPARLAQTPWLFNSFMKSNATDVCARLGLRAADFGSQLDSAGVSPAPDCRADQPRQYEALQRFLRRAEVIDAAATRITQMRLLVTEYARQHQLTGRKTALIDAGWTGRMIGALVTVSEGAGMQRPHMLLWGHEPRATGWTDPDRVTAYIYNTSTGEGMSLRVPDAPFLVETFCMADHGVVTGYQRASDGQIVPVLAAEENKPARDWGLGLYRTVLFHVCDALTGSLEGDVRPLIHDVMDAFWCSPTIPEAAAWGAYRYDSDPAGTAIRPLARPFEDAGQAGDASARGDRAWIHGSVALSHRPVDLPCDLLQGAPATD
jgi:hypothetical protein